MKNKNITFYIKKNLIGFVVAIFITTGVGAYALATFPSIEVTYDNKASNLNSTNVQGAIDELYKTCTQTTASQIIEDAGLEKDPYECRYFFTGANPNNYITFNNETWRIISAECDGTIKIIKIDDLGYMEWNNNSNRGVYNNDWSEPASLNTYLNETYYNSLSSVAKNQIVAHNWSIGPATEGNNDLEGQVNNENSKIWNGKIALITSSEYIRLNSNKSQCNSFKLAVDNLHSCRTSNWRFITSVNSWWTLTPYSSNSERAFILTNSGTPGTGARVNGKDNVFPALYLSSKLKLSGTGTQSDPYTIS